MGNKINERHFLPLLPIILVPIVLFSPLIFRNQALFWGTPALQFIPWASYAIAQMRQGIWPLWNSLNGMGAPLAANYQIGLYYPFNWLLLGVGWLAGTDWMAWAFTWMVVLHLIIAGWGMAQLARLMGINPLGQCISGLSFALSGFIVARAGFFSMTWCVAWMPWIILETEKIVQCPPTDRFHFSPRLSLIVTMMLLAGHAQLSWYILLFSLVWIVYRTWTRSGWKSLLMSVSDFAAACFVAGLIAGIQLVPTAEYLFQTQRASAFDYETALTYSFWPWRIFGLLAPNLFGSPGSGDYWGYASFWEDALYIGLLPILLALGTLKSIIKKIVGKNREEKPEFIIGFLWIVILVAIVFALGNNTPIFPFLFRYIPSFNMFQAPTRWMVLAEFCLALLAGYGVKYWTPAKGKALYWTRLATAGAFAVTLGAGLASLAMKDIHVTFVYATATAGLWGLGVGILTLTMPEDTANRRMRWWQAAVIIWVAMDLIFADIKLNPGVDVSFYYGEKNVSSVVNNGTRIYLNPNDEYALKYRRFLRFNDFNAKEDWRNMREVLLPNLNLLDKTASVNNFDPFVPARYSLWMEQLSQLPAAEAQKWLALMDVGSQETINLQNLTVINWKLIPGAARYRWNSCARYVRDSQESLIGTKEEIQNIRSITVLNTIVLESDIQSGEKTCIPDSSAVIKITKDQPNQTIVEVNATNEGWLLQADVWFPGWKATLDGQPIQIMKGDFLFRAVKVPTGSHEIIISYQPDSFWIGAILSIVGIILLLGLYFLNWKDKPSSPS
jgi:uncharacterized membrane protein YfhO